MASVGTQTEFRDRIRLKVGEVTSSTLVPTDPAVDLAIDEGLDYLNRTFARDHIYEGAGSDTKMRYVLDTLAGLEWSDGYSQLINVAHTTDAGEDDESIRYLEKLEEYETRRDTLGQTVLFLSSPVGTDKDLRLEIQSTWYIDPAIAAQTTVRDSDTTLLTTYCASSVCFWIARRASELENTSLGVSEVDYGKLSSYWSERATELRDEATEIVSGTETAASAITTMPMATKSKLNTGGRRISH